MQQARASFRFPRRGISVSRRARQPAARRCESFCRYSRTRISATNRSCRANEQYMRVLHHRSLRLRHHPRHRGSCPDRSYGRRHHQDYLYACRSFLRFRYIRIHAPGHCLLSASDCGGGIFPLSFRYRHSDRRDVLSLSLLCEALLIVLSESRLSAECRGEVQRVPPSICFPLWQVSRLYKYLPAR